MKVKLVDKSKVYLMLLLRVAILETNDNIKFDISVVKKSFDEIYRLKNWSRCTVQEHSMIREFYITYSTVEHTMIREFYSTYSAVEHSMIHEFYIT